MTEFKQIIGRGTRLLEEYGKTYFTIMDFRNASRLFADPAFDGVPEVVVDLDGNDPVNDPETEAEQGNEDNANNTNPEGVNKENEGNNTGDNNAFDDEDKPKKKGAFLNFFKEFFD